MKIELLFRIDIGFDIAGSRGYAAVIYDVQLDRQKGIRGNSMEQLASRIRHALIDEMGRRKHFPLESEPQRIITPNGL